MPREMIKGSSEPFNIKVGWHHDVQVGIEADQQRSLNWLLYGSSDDALVSLGELIAKAYEDIGNDHEELGRAVLNALDCIPGSIPYYGVWAHLDRRGCNDLIRTIRKARDRAFGRDE